MREKGMCFRIILMLSALLIFAGCADKRSAKNGGAPQDAAQEQAAETAEGAAPSGAPASIDLSQYPPASRVLLRFPYASGTSSIIVQGNNSFPTHSESMRFALDFLLDEGTPLLAVRGGKVVKVVQHFSEGGSEEAMRGRENYVKIEHDDGSCAVYMHITHNGARVRSGQHVMAGDVVALNGSTGYSSTPHLHFQINVSSASEESIPVFFDTADGPIALVEGMSYTAPEYDGAGKPLPLAKQDTGGMGEFARLQDTLAQIVSRESDLKQASMKFTAYLKEHEAELKLEWKQINRRAFDGDKKAMDEIAAILNREDMSRNPAFARILGPENPYRELTDEGMLIYWGLMSE